MGMLEWAEKEVEIACKKENPDWKPGEFDYGCSCYESALKAFKSLLEDMKGVLRKNKEAAIRADAHLITDKRNLDQVSYDIGYFQGRDACFMEILDLIDKKTRKEVERNRDRRKSKQNR